MAKDKDKDEDKHDSKIHEAQSHNDDTHDHKKKKKKKHKHKHDNNPGTTQTPPPDPAPDFDPDPTNKDSKHIYFAVPASNGTGDFSGQYLRLEEYIGKDEDPHLPESLPPATGLKGIAISSTGYFLVNAKVGLYETYGKALTEKITGDHTITIAKGDWTLIAENGGITIETAAETEEAYMKFVSTDSDITFEAFNGKASTSDRFDVKVSDQDTVTFVYGFEYSGVNGLNTKTYVGFVMNLNIAGDLSIKILDVKTEAFPMKIGNFSSTYLIGSAKFQLIYGKFGIIDSKRMIVYNKITGWQIYKDMVSTETKLVKDDLTALTKMEDKIAKAESHAVDVGMMQLLKM